MTDRATPDRADAPAPLAPGWYWVQLPSKKWSAAKCEISQHTRAPIFFIVGSDHTFIERNLREIGPRIPSPDERTPGQSSAPLAERLREAIEAAARIIAPHETPRKRPTIEELEKLLQQSDSPPVTINPDGSISAGVSDALVVAQALLAALDGREAGWLPIESAPKDRLIDIWIAEDDGSGVRWCNCYYDQICDQWRTSRPSGHLIWVPARAVTHWREPPAPPARPQPAGGTGDE